MTAYSRQLQSARRMIAKKGQAVTWAVFSPGTTDPVVTPGASRFRPKPIAGATPVTHSVRIVFLPVGRVNYESLSARGIEVQDGYSLGYMANTPGLTPNLADHVVRGSKRYAIRHIDILAPDGVPLLYTILFAAPVEV